MPLRAMVYGVPAAARSPSLQAHQLADEPRVVWQFNAGAVDRRQKLPVEVGLAKI